MSGVLEDRVKVLEDKMEGMEANPQPGQNQAFSDSFKEVRTGVRELRADFKRFGDVQAQQTQSLTKLDGDVTGLQKKLKEVGVVQEQHTRHLQRHHKMLDDLLLFVCRTKDDLQEFRVDVNDFKTEVTSEIGTLKTDVAGLKTDVAELKTDVAGLKTDVAELKTDVAGLKTDMTEVKGTLALILDRLPAKAV